MKNQKLIPNDNLKGQYNNLKFNEESSYKKLFNSKNKNHQQWEFASGHPPHY